MKYKKRTLLVCDVKEEEIKSGHMMMEKWSILSDVVKYVQYNQYQIEHYELEVKVPEEWYGTVMYKRLQDSERDVKEVSYNSNSESLKQEYLHIFEGVNSGIVYTTQYDDNNNIGTTYLDMSRMRRQDEWKAEHKPPITEDCYIQGKLLESTDCMVLLDMETSKSFMSKTFLFKLTIITFFAYVYIENTEYFSR